MQGDLALWAERRYFVSGVVIRFIVAWRPKDAPKDESDNAILLVDLHLNKKKE